MSIVDEETRWFKDGQQLQVNNASDNRLVTSGGNNGSHPSLIIWQLSREDSGDYFCELHNAMGRGRPKLPLRLSVLYVTSVVLQIEP
ncbi:neuromusculin-like protein, partial [Leptotrombidium deliense]